MKQEIFIPINGSEKIEERIYGAVENGIQDRDFPIATAVRNVLALFHMVEGHPVEREDLISFIEDCIREGFNQGHYSFLHPEQYPPQEGGSFCAKKASAMLIRFQNRPFGEYQKMLEREKKVIDGLVGKGLIEKPVSEHKRITGFDTPEEYDAYENGKDAMEGTIMKFIREWDGSTNSWMGEALAQKMAEMQKK